MAERPGPGAEFNRVNEFLNNKKPDETEQVGEMEQLEELPTSPEQSPSINELLNSEQPARRLGDEAYRNPQTGLSDVDRGAGNVLPGFNDSGEVMKKELGEATGGPGSVEEAQAAQEEMRGGQSIGDLLNGPHRKE